MDGHYARSVKSGLSKIETHNANECESQKTLAHV
ncbi:hypothetical protein T11_11446 [Trichinella zimbabwensis]|uniref:Uncharacterized protein n=1 Tax=Trichinella zimbabwensis TaxID=268475 RepID=A0A0V1GL12_9BILA|nr:hypothetical protein T11_11446 [Trichinella zimbabwensis]